MPEFGTTDWLVDRIRRDEQAIDDARQAGLMGRPAPFGAGLFASTAYANARSLAGHDRGNEDSSAPRYSGPSHASAVSHASRTSPVQTAPHVPLSPASRVSIGFIVLFSLVGGGGPFALCYTTPGKALLHNASNWLNELAYHEGWWHSAG